MLKILKNVGEINFALNRMTVVRNIENKCGQSCREIRTLHSGSLNVQWCNHFGNSITIPQKLKIELLYDPAISLLSIYSEELKGTISMFMTALFTVAQRSKPKYALIDEQINKL